MKTSLLIQTFFFDLKYVMNKRLVLSLANFVEVHFDAEVNLQLRIRIRNYGYIFMAHFKQKQCFKLTQ